VSSDSSARWRCSAASLDRDEPVAGSATHVRTWVLLEHVGPWGRTALLDARLPDGLGDELRRRAQEHRAKILLIRRFTSEPSSRDGLRVFAAHAHPTAPRLESGLLGDAREVLDLDLAAFRAGGTTGLPAYDGEIYCVCTNGRHDACCAELGRPVAKALAAAHPEETWEVSHVGGDRFAGNMVVLPHGLYYGRLDPATALSVVAAHRAGEVDLDRLRGRSSYAMPVQAAEIAVRRELGLTGLAQVRLTGASRDGDLTRALFATPEGGYAVSVRTDRSTATPAKLTCRAARSEPAVTQEIVDLAPWEP
jgi:hypothetical protein